uniref:Alpha 1,4-glycosyltransferase domain-containing protein n=1 Tax=Noctiluca scintillans TaxID=2966 RepID=A0A7S1AG96_NOCSC|mmetsp:Transcript_45065/g.119554  ORF Transcript_45065/g.119554 Transcript_45065/m.119554 type:complete len:1009 (+) Transcript_45065:56-3082(+)
MVPDQRGRETTTVRDHDASREHRSASRTASSGAFHSSLLQTLREDAAMYTQRLHETERQIAIEERRLKLEAELLQETSAKKKRNKKKKRRGTSQGVVRTCEPPWVATLGHANEAFSGQNTLGTSGGAPCQKVTDLNVVIIKEKAAFPAELPKVATVGSVGDATVEDARSDSDEKPSHESSGLPCLNACREDLSTDDSEHCMRILDFERAEASSPLRGCPAEETANQNVCLGLSQVGDFNNGLVEGSPETPRRPTCSLPTDEVEKEPFVFPQLIIQPICEFDHWDRQECAVQNTEEWRQLCTHQRRGVIPKLLHQIWIGPKEPPCLWLDTFRIDYISKYPDWTYQLWTEDEVRRLSLLNRDIYEEEHMWQCKADILRLEVLWQHGGLYVDADMISVEGRSLEKLLDVGRETGFVMAYEPDTKDKPYSILGNSVIACTPHHPLIMMLMLYLKQTYHAKRHIVEVFAVTGPVMYTKCLIDSNMPLTIAAQELLYPAFHYIPNPDAIDFSRFTECLMFQFGYTCSGLEGYVKRKNRCRKARKCYHHSRSSWPFGEFRPLLQLHDVEWECQHEPAISGIPRVIHQLVWDGVDSCSDPVRWRETWWSGFRNKHLGFEYRAWSKKDLMGRKWFCANLYLEPLDDQASLALMLEVLFNEGGFFVPLSTLYTADHELNHTLNMSPGADFLEAGAGIVGAVKGSPGCYKRLMEVYDGGSAGIMPFEQFDPDVVRMGFWDGTVSQCMFAAQTQSLGAGQIVALADQGGDGCLERACLQWAYECQVACLAPHGQIDPRMFQHGVVFVTDYDFFQLRNLQVELPGLLCRLHQKEWDAMLFGCEWETGSDEVVLFEVTPGGRPRHCHVVGVVVNFPNARDTKLLKQVFARCITDDGFDAEPFFSEQRLALMFGAEKYSGSLEYARLCRVLPLVQHCFSSLARHKVDVDTDDRQTNGNRMKGFRHGSMLFELSVETHGNTLFRGWNANNSMICELKMDGRHIEWMRVYRNNAVTFEALDEAVP